MSPVGNMSQILSPIQAENPHKSLRALLRNPPELAPGDSLHRFVQLLRFEPIGALPVTENGRLVGIIAHADLVPVLRSADGAARSAEMQRPVADFMRPFEGHNVATFSMQPAGDATTVTWAMTGPSAFIPKLMGVFMNMDRMIGNDFEAGLANLKAVAEK